MQDTNPPIESQYDFTPVTSAADAINRIVHGFDDGLVSVSNTYVGLSVFWGPTEWEDHGIWSLEPRVEYDADSESWESALVRLVNDVIAAIRKDLYGDKDWTHAG